MISVELVPGQTAMTLSYLERRLHGAHYMMYRANMLLPMLGKVALQQ